MIGQALSHFATTFPVGLVLAGGFFGLCRLGGRAYENSLRVKERPARFEPMDFSEEIRVIDRTRRGPDCVSSAGRRS